MTRRRTALVLSLVLVLVLVVVPAALAGKGDGGSGGGKPGGGGGSGCAITPGQAALDQVWTTSAWGLPTGSTVNQIITFPDGDKSIRPITVASGGTYTTTGNSNMSYGWGFILPEQKGTYSYQFTGKLTWPGPTSTKYYATCSVVVS